MVKPAASVTRRRREVFSTSVAPLFLLAKMYTSSLTYSLSTSPLTAVLSTEFYLGNTHLLTCLIYSPATRRGHSPTLTSHGHRFDNELNRLEAEAARRKERLEHKKQRKRKRDRSAHNRRTNKRKNRRRSEDRKARAQTRLQMGHVQARLPLPWPRKTARIRRPIYQPH